MGLSGAAVALLAGRDSLAAAAEKAANPANDVAILNTALAAELEAIAAYGVGAGSGLLKGAGVELSRRRSRAITSSMPMCSPPP